MPAWAIFLLSLALSAPAAVTIVRGRERTRVERARAFERELSSELLAAGRPHTFLPLSGVTHMTPQEVVAENLLLVQLDFLRRALGIR